MKKFGLITLILLSVLFACSEDGMVDQRSSDADEATTHSKIQEEEFDLEEAAEENKESNDETGVTADENLSTIKVVIGDAFFEAKIYDSAAATDFLSRLPLTLSMSDLNQNEKYAYLNSRVAMEEPTAPSTIYSGDIMYWSSDSLVLFYETFQNSYGGYQRLGYIEDTQDLSAALGKGDVEVTFSR